MLNSSLPVWQLHADIVRTLMTGNQLVLVAATGSGKTTQVPQMLLDAGAAAQKRIVILQPRRVAARTVAARVAWERGNKLGREVGYQVRFEEHLSEASQLCFVTEGILLRWLQNDHELRDVGVVIFDEFHERNLLSDVALALVKRLQQTTRPDLKIVVMSATLEAEPVARYLASDPQRPVPILISEGRAFPVTIRWTESIDHRPAPERAVEAVEAILRTGEPGDILVFMPGKAEINSTINALRNVRLTERCSFLPLHGDLAPDDQDRAFQRAEVRKIVVATNVAETSVTIDGVCHVVDAGTARISRYDAERGLQTLAIEDISRASADQRAGRAGRTAPGTCWRLWTESHHLTRPAKNIPEIQRADLAETVLLLHSLGVEQAAEFDWLDQPDREAVQRSEALLTILGALENGALTPIGRQMLRLPMHPRYSRMLVEAGRRGCVFEAAQCAALVSGRDLLMHLGRDDAQLKEAREVFEENVQSDFHTLIRAHAFARSCNFDLHACQRMGIHAQTARQVEDTFRQLLQIARREGLIREENSTPEKNPPPDSEALAKCLLAGFIDQLAARQDANGFEFQLTEGRAGTLVRESVVTAPLAVVASLREVDGRGGRMTLLGLATAVEPEWIAELFPQHLTITLEHVFDRTHKRVAAIRQERCLGLIIGQKHQRDVEPVAAGRALAEAFGNGWFELPNLGHDVKQFTARVNLVCAALPELEFPPFDTSAMLAALTRAFAGLTLVKEAQTVELRPHFRRHLAPVQLEWLDELLPLSIPWPEAGKVKLSYSEPDRKDQDAWPTAQVKLTTCRDLKEHPVLCEGKVPVRLWLLLPDGKRLDDTTDFPQWKTTRYPKHRATLRAKYPAILWP
jgi:ATP-dependent helicase HrpB